METSLVKVCAWLWPPLLAQLQGLPGHLGMWQSRHFSEHRARLPKAQTKVTQQCHHFTNLWGAQELLIESFQELQVPFIDTVPTLPAAEWAGSMHPNLPAPSGIPRLLLNIALKVLGENWALKGVSSWWVKISLLFIQCLWDFFPICSPSVCVWVYIFSLPILRSRWGSKICDY